LGEALPIDLHGPPGFKLVNCDLSQIELRIAAWMANERTMLEIYRTGGDIHTATAKYVNGLLTEQWNALARANARICAPRPRP
jgi:DNA polymerase I-like protein with 3'-5' exonuclease and polymerase domains